MAAADKIYGTMEQYDEFKSWLEDRMPHAVKYLYPRDGYEHPFCRPISNFPEQVDKELLACCTIGWVRDYILGQYYHLPVGSY